MTLLLNCKDISLEYPTKRVLDAVTLGISDGERIGVVGKNGDGKSTLLQLLAGEKIPDSGEIIKNSAVTIGTLQQTDQLDPEQTVLHEVAGNAAEHEWAANRRTREILDALLCDISQTDLVGELSGGQRRRVDLARLLIGDWDILMLDEPTNHLDIQTITWLADHLKTRWPKDSGALLVVTHDRWFLDEVCTAMWEVHSGQVRPFEGGYSAYILQRVERDRLERLREQKHQNLLRKELAWLSRGARARSSKPKFHLKVAQDLIEHEPPPRNTLELKQAAMTRLGKQVIELESATKALGGRTLIDNVTWLIGPGDRFAVLGANGVGKTTLLRILEGKLPLDHGLIKIGKTVSMAVLSQQLEELDPFAQERVREVLAQYKKGYEVDGKSLSPAQLLERLGFEREHLQTRVFELSGGQKRRLQLLLTLLKEPNVLILDEPGNDFDTDMLAIMEDLLDSWPGTLVLVSHDRYLVERVSDHQYALIDGHLRHLPGGVDEYLRITSAQARSAKAAFSRQGHQEAPIEHEETATLSGGDAYKARKEVASLERKMATTEKEIEAVDAKMHQVDPSNFEELATIQAEKQALQQELSNMETRWLELSEQL